MVPDSQFVISRTATRDNKSDYYIDGRRSNFTEVGGGRGGWMRGGAAGRQGAAWQA